MIKEISSIDNPLIKKIVKLEQKKYRDRENAFVCSGFNVINEIVEKHDIECLFVREDLKQHEAVRACVKREVDVAAVSGDLFKKISDTETAQGIMAIVKKTSIPIKNIERSSYVIIECIQDPGNLGTIIRSADAAGISQVVIVKGTVDIYSPKAVRACAGSLFRVSIKFTDNITEATDYVKKMGAYIFAAKPDVGEAYYNCSIARNVAIIIGNEGSGVSEKAEHASDDIINIPMTGNIESLNAGVAASIIMFEGMRQEAAFIENRQKMNK